MRKVYIAGPMTGRPHYNHAAFAEAKRRWQEAGYIVQTPFDANSRVWQRHYGRPFDPTVDTCDYGDPLLREMFAEDISTMLHSDLVALLPGWEYSSGVSRELPVALLFEMPTYDAETMEPLRVSASITLTKLDVRQDAA